MRQITIVLGIIIFVGSIFGAQEIISSKKSFKSREIKALPFASVRTVENKTISVSIREQGRLIAKKKD